MQASIVVFLLAGSSAPTPLYAVYQAAWGFSAITTTVVFGVYALAVLASLLVFGSLSDHVGRRPVLVVALVLQAVTMLIFTSAEGVHHLVLARVLQGLSTGAAVSTLGAGLLDLQRARGTIANAVAPMTGTASGAIGSGVMVQYLPEPTHLVYLLLIAVFAVQIVGVLVMPETSTQKPGALASLRPRFAMPPAARLSFLVAVPALIAIWSLVGFYASLGPALVRLVTGSSSFVLGGLSLFVMAGSAGLSVILVQRFQPRAVMLVGLVALVTGVALTVLATVAVSAGLTTATSTILLFVGTTVAGLGFGASFQGALRTVLPLIAPADRAGALSVLYAVSYLAMGAPAVVGGFLAVHGGVLTAGREYGAGVIVLATVALLGLLWARAPRPNAASATSAPVRCPQSSPLPSRA